MEGQEQVFDTQPSPMEMAQQAALAIIQKEEGIEPPKEAPKEAQPETEAPKEEPKEAPKEEAKEEEVPQPRKLRLKYRGEEKEVDETEAVELAQKGYDYTQKSQALAKEREELASKAKAEQENARKQYETRLTEYSQLVMKLADQEALNADLSKLAETDPAKALQLRLRRDQIVETLQAVRSEQQRLANERQNEAREAYAKTVREAVETLQRDVPGWSQDLYGKVLKTGLDYGLRQEEVNAIADPRLIKVLNDARQWREFQAAKPKAVEKRVAEVPKVQKPGTTEKPDPGSEKLKESMANLKKNGSREAAQDYVLRLMEAGRL